MNAEFNPTFQIIGMQHGGVPEVSKWMLGHIDNWIFYEDACLRGDRIESEKISRNGNGRVKLFEFQDYNFLYLQDHLPNRINVLVLRDPFNLFANRFRVVRTSPNCGDLLSCRAIETWKSYAKAFVDDRFLELNLSEWNSNQIYRKQLSCRLGLDHDDCQFKPLDNHLWRELQFDEEYLAFFDEEMISLSETIFGLLPGTSQWCRLQLKPDIDYRQSIEKIVEATQNCVMQGDLKSANELLAQASKVFPGNTRLNQQTTVLHRGLLI